MKSERWRRRNYLVRRTTQLRFIAMLLLQMSVILAALGILVYSHVTRIREIAAGVPIVDVASRAALEGELIDSVHVFFDRSLVLVGVALVLLLGFGLLASHKLAGPVIKLQRHLGDIAGGDFSKRITFRRSDYLDELAENVNRMTEAVESRRLLVRELVAELGQGASRLEPGSRDERVLDELDQVCVALREAA